jgi:hypothetical protein
VKPAAHVDPGELVFRVTNLGQIEFHSIEAKPIIEKAAVKGDPAEEFPAAVFRPLGLNCHHATPVTSQACFGEVLWW